jgi:hypothetical protein
VSILDKSSEKSSPKKTEGTSEKEAASNANRQQTVRLSNISASIIPEINKKTSVDDISELPFTDYTITILNKNLEILRRKTKRESESKMANEAAQSYEIQKLNEQIELVNDAEDELDRKHQNH